MLFLPREQSIKDIEDEAEGFLYVAQYEYFKDRERIWNWKREELNAVDSDRIEEDH